MPTGTDSNWTNILHFTTGTDCCDFGSQSPAIWFNPSSAALYVSIGDSTDWNWGIDPPDVLPLNISTKVTLECRGNYVKLTVGTRVYTAKQPTDRFVGNLIVYAGDPGWPTAKAIISNLHYEILPAAGGNVGKTLNNLRWHGARMRSALSKHVYSMVSKVVFWGKQRCVIGKSWFSSVPCAI